MNAKFLIRVGAGAEYQLRYGRNGFAVFRKTLGSVVTYIIAKDIKAGDGDPPPIPTSPLREYDTQAAAIAALDKWAAAPVDPKPIRKPKAPGNARRNPNPPRSRKVGEGQTDFFIQ